MDDAFADECEEAVADLAEHFDGICLWVMVVAFDIFGEVAIAKFLDDVVVFGALHDVVEGDDVFGVQFLQDVDFIFECGLEVVVVVNFDNRHAYCFVWARS